MSHIQKLILVLIFCLFFITRIYDLTKIPSSLYWDEASINYNAYSIATTLKDEWGDTLPLHFRAFGEFKLPVYIYSTAILSKFFGLEEWVVRIPAILYSGGVVLVTFLLSRKLFNSQTVGLMSAFILTVMPWFYIFSRTGYEATAGLMYFMLGVYLMLKRGHQMFILAAAISFLLSIYSYNSYRLIAPITFLGLFGFLMFQTPSKRQFTFLIMGLLFLIVGFIPILRLYFFDSGLIRAQQLADPGSNLVQKLFFNLGKHSSPTFLLGGDINPRSQIPGQGQLYMIDLILIGLGIVMVARQKTKPMLLPFGIIILGLIPASLFREAPHALRSLTVVPFIAMLAAFGASLFGKRKIILTAICLVYLGFFANYFYLFLNKYPNQSSNDWQLGYKKVFTEYSDRFSSYDNIVISDGYAQPYIFALNYLKIAPDEFRATVEYNPPADWGFSTVDKIGKLYFNKIGKEEFPSGKSLVFALPQEKIESQSIGSIYNLDGSISLEVYEYVK